MKIPSDMKTLRAIILLLAVTTLGGCTTLAPQNTIPVANTQHTIYFVYRKWHTSIVLEADQLAARSPKLANALGAEKFARIGWGDGDYFTGKSKSWSTATKALFASRYSALQLLTYGNELLTEIPPETIVPLAISDQGLARLTAFINASVAVDAQNIAIGLPAKNADTGLFFQSTERYNVFNNCNTWSGKALRLAGLPIANRLTAQGIFQQAQAISRVQAYAGLFDASKTRNINKRSMP